MPTWQKSSSFFVAPKPVLNKKKQVNCNGIDGVLFEDYLDYGKMNYYSAGKLVGVVTNGRLFSTNCKKTHEDDLSTCCKCSEMLQSLQTRETFTNVLSKALKGCKINTVMMNSPRILYKLVNELITHIQSCPQSEDETRMVKLYRDAKNEYEKEWAERDEIKEVNIKSSTNPRTTHILPSEKAPKINIEKQSFEDTFFVKFLQNQLSNFARPSTHHTFPENLKRYWIVGKHFSGKQFFTRMGGNRNQKTPCNWRSHLQYNMIMPSVSTFKNWMPKGEIGFCKYFDYVVKSLTPESCRKVVVTIDGMKVLKKVDNMLGRIVGTIKPIDGTNLRELETIEFGDISDEMLYFNVAAIDNSWYAPLGWFPISSKINIIDYIVDKFKEIDVKLKDHSLEFVCGCADGEVDATITQDRLRQCISPYFIF